MPLGHDSFEQSRTPLPKSIFVHRQVMLLAAQPKLGARLIMLLIQFFCAVSVNDMTVFMR